MRYLSVILIFASAVFAEGFKSAAMCTVAGGVEYCIATDGNYSVVKMNGTVVTSKGFDIFRYHVTGDQHDTIADDRTKVRITPLVSEDNVSSIMFEGKNRLWIGDASGCVTMKYFRWDTETIKKKYQFVPVDPDRFDILVEKISQCMARQQDLKQQSP